MLPLDHERFGLVKIQLSGSSEIALIDDADRWVLSYKWFCAKDGYARRNLPSVKGKHLSGITLMHRLIIHAPSNNDIDHINGNRLDNRRSNLRVCTRAQNLRNSSRHFDNTSGYKGVVRQKDKWRARIWVEPKNLSLGTFNSATEAAQAYNEAAMLYYGEYARPNIVKELIH